MMTLEKMQTFLVLILQLEQFFDTKLFTHSGKQVR